MHGLGNRGEIVGSCARVSGHSTVDALFEQAHAGLDCSKAGGVEGCGLIGKSALQGTARAQGVRNFMFDVCDEAWEVRRHRR